jgi:hypothetical protein
MKVIHVLRKPLSEKTVTANVLKHGTGAVHIDPCRIPREDSEKGGWPGNMIVQHLAECAEECAQGCPVAALGSASAFFKAIGGGSHPLEVP